MGTLAEYEEKMRAIEAERRKKVEIDRRKEAIIDRIKAQRYASAYEASRQQCLLFCTALHATLPRELRDMIYDQLIPPGLRHHVFEALDEHGQPRISSNPLVHVSFFDPRSRMPAQVSVRRDVWRYREYVGDVVAKEIAERWYHTGLFILDAEDLMVGKFLGTDVWEREVDPAGAVRHVRIQIKCYCFDDGWDGGEMVEGMLKSFEELSRITNKKTEIVFFLSKSEALWRTRRILELLAPSVYRLRREGFRGVKVLRGGCDVGRSDVTHVFDEPVEMFGVNLTRNLLA